MKQNEFEEHDDEEATTKIFNVRDAVPPSPMCLQLRIRCATFVRMVAILYAVNV